MSFKRRCYCPKCDGLLVSERTERAHRNGPAFRQLEAASRQPASGRQRHGPNVEPPTNLLQPNTNLNVSHSEVDCNVQNSEIATAEQNVSIHYYFC